MPSVIVKKSLTLFVALSLCGVSSYILYSMLKKDEEEDDDLSMTELRKKTDLRVVKIQVPKELLGSIIGRNGSNIKMIQEESNARVNFERNETGKFATCIIRGKFDDCEVAEYIIKTQIANQPLIERFDMSVPQSVVGKIIGRCGEQINEISDHSGAQIRVSNEGRNDPTRNINIRGTKEQIALAKMLINEIIENFHTLDAKFNASLAKREPRLRSKSPTLKLPPSPHVERISPILGQSDSPFEVYVSAMIDPSHFWIQIVGPKATELDQLVEEMTEYYNSAENKENHVLNSIEVGDLVAAIFECDQKWYRAEVLKLKKEGEATSLELYYLDYGDTEVISLDQAFELRTDFLRLNFQAIECFLAGIEPADGKWSEDSKDMFAELTHVAKWKKLSARMNGYCTRGKTRAKRESSPVPGVELFDANVDRDVNVAQELVHFGFAKFKKDTNNSQPL